MIVWIYAFTSQYLFMPRTLIKHVAFIILLLQKSTAKNGNLNRRTNRVLYVRTCYLLISSIT